MSGLDSSENIHPVDAVNLGADDTVCGDCPHRKQSDGSRSCYVNVGQAPAAVWKSYKRGIYGQLSDLNPSDLRAGRSAGALMVILQ